MRTSYFQAHTETNTNTHTLTCTHTHTHTYTHTHARTHGRAGGSCAQWFVQSARESARARDYAAVVEYGHKLCLFFLQSQLPQVSGASKGHMHTHTHTHTHTYSLTHSLTHSLTPLNMCYSGLLESVSDRDLQELCCPRTRRAVEMGVRPPTRHSLALAVRLCGSVPRPFAVLLAAHKHRLARFALLPALHCMALQGRCW